MERIAILQENRLTHKDMRSRVLVHPDDGGTRLYGDLRGSKTRSRDGNHGLFRTGHLAKQAAHALNEGVSDGNDQEDADDGSRTTGNDDGTVRKDDIGGHASEMPFVGRMPVGVDVSHG